MKNPVIPYALIAGLGIFAVILVSILGVNQRNDIESAEEGEPAEEQAEEGETADDPEEIFMNTCAACHGEDLSGESGPDLTEIGNDYSAEDIQQIILDGKGQMPPQDVADPQAEAIAEWLLDQQ